MHTPAMWILRKRDENKTMAEPRVKRFDWTQRALHWSHAITFFVLLATGTILLVRPIGEVVGQHLLILTIHEYTSVFYITGPLVWLLLGNRRALLRDIRQFDEWDEDDIDWLKKSIIRVHRPGTCPRRVALTPDRS